MSDIRIFSYLPNPRVYKALIAARYSGATIEVIGDTPPEMVNWLWDYEAVKLDDEGRKTHAAAQRTASTGFSGTVYKTDGFLKANPFGDIPAAFAENGSIGVFESNSIMRLAALTGPNAPALYGASPAEQARIDGFLDKTLLFADLIQKYILAGDGLTDALHATMDSAFERYCTTLNDILTEQAYLASDTLSLADIVMVCEFAMMSHEGRMVDKLTSRDLAPILPKLRHYPALHGHIKKLLALNTFAADLKSYEKFMHV